MDVFEVVSAVDPYTTVTCEICRRRYDRLQAANLPDGGSRVNASKKVQTFYGLCYCGNKIVTSQVAIQTSQ